MRRRSGGERGNARVEFALASAFLFPMLFGVWQLGYVMYKYNKLQTAIRAGARYAALKSYDSGSANPSNAFTQAVRNMVVYSSAAAGTTPVVPGLTPSAVNLEVTMDGAVPRIMRVYVSDFTLNTGIGTYRLQGKPSAAFIYTGRPMP